jgi:histidinol-phosphatase (PHP family)
MLGKSRAYKNDDLKMEANYHTHTWRCRHASGTERDYIENAIDHGIRILGFSDHTPYPFPDGYSSGFRMRIDQLGDYVMTLEMLRDEYRDDIDIRIGLEVEYYPAYFSDLLRLIDNYPIEYLLLGQHFLGNERGEAYSGMPTASEKKLARYVEQTKEAMETGRFAYFAHPDLFNFIGPAEIYDRYMRELCESAKSLHIPLELNFLGLYDGRNYPHPQFWEIAGEVGCDVIYGADAHAPDMVWNPWSLGEAQAMTEKYRLHLIRTLEPDDHT